MKLGLFDASIHPLRDGETGIRAEIVQFAGENGMAALADRWLPGMMQPTYQENSEIMGPLRAMVLRKDPELHARQINALMQRPDAAASGHVEAVAVWPNADHRKCGPLFH